MLAGEVWTDSRIPGEAQAGLARSVVALAAAYIMAEDETRLIRQWYAGALQRDPEERDDNLDRVCVDRPDLRQRVAALLEEHSGLFDQGTSSPDETLACEYVPGPALRALIDSGPVPIEQVVDIGVQLARALARTNRSC